MIEFEAEGDYWLMEKAGDYDCIEESVIINGIEINEEEQYLLLSRPLVD